MKLVQLSTSITSSPHVNLGQPFFDELAQPAVVAATALHPHLPGEQRWAQLVGGA